MTTGKCIVRFDRGTLVVSGLAAEMEGTRFDPRTHEQRLPGHCFAEIAERADREGFAIEGDLRERWSSPVGAKANEEALGLRHYQRDALAAWDGFLRRGVIVLPTGAGKTRVAIGAMLRTGLPGAVLCPTRALAGEWVSELRRWLGDVGLVGDGEWRLGRTTVLTFESAFRHLDTLGDRFGLLVVDEVHHFGSGVRREALEASPAIARLGLTATPPEAGSDQADAIRRLVGPTVYELGYEDLVGRHLAPVDFVRLEVPLAPPERTAYEEKTAKLSALRRAFLAHHPIRDLEVLMRALVRTDEGREALREHQQARSLAAFPNAKRDLVASLLAHHREDRTIVFTALAENAYVVATDNLVPVISAVTSPRERREILTQFRAGAVKVIVTARVLNEGIDVPDARVAIIVAGTQGKREHVQRIGRVLRPAPGKRALVYELLTTNTTDARRALMREDHAAAHTS